jgi:hypothetical protein
MPFLLDRLPTEILYLIFSYLSPFEISFSFSNISKHLNNILHGYDLQYSINFRNISQKQLCSLKQHLRPERVISLFISNDENNLAKAKYFLSLFDMKLFTRLRSLSLSNIDNKSADLLLPHLVRLSLHQLTSLSITNWCTNSRIYELLNLHAKSLQRLRLSRAAILNRNIFPKHLQHLVLTSTDIFYLRTILQRLDHSCLIDLDIQLDDKPIIEKLLSSFERHSQSLTCLFLKTNKGKSIKLD